LNCPHCHAQMPPEDSFCEECGRQLTRPPLAQAAAACAHCGAAPELLDTDGFCSSCGLRGRQNQSRDRLEFVISPSFAGVSDRGRKHHRNEDFLAMLLEPEGRHVLVACDGVSSTLDADRASETAAETAMRALVRGVSMDSALGVAQKAVSDLAQHSVANAENPATTIVAAVVTPCVVANGHSAPAVRVTIGWLGDSRAYWITPNEVKQLTRDHSWLTEVVESDEMDEQAALASSQAHAITRWLGADADAPESAGSTQTFIVSAEFSAPGSLLLCTDGLWNYAPEPESIAQLLRSASGDAISKARELVAFANARGGHDNITVILLTL